MVHTFVADPLLQYREPTLETCIKAVLEEVWNNIEKALKHGLHNNKSGAKSVTQFCGVAMTFYEASENGSAAILLTRKDYLTNDEIILN